MPMRSGRTAFVTGLLPTVLACAVPATGLAQQAPVSSIRVTGDARVTAKPDRVQIDIGVTTRAAQSQDAAVQNARQVDAVLAAVRKAAGANHVQGFQFTLRDQDAVRAEALREAALRARGEADVLAAALGLKVLRVLSVEENSPRVVPVRVYGGAPRAMAAAAPATPVEAGTLDVTADVTLSVEVGPAPR